MRDEFIKCSLPNWSRNRWTLANTFYCAVNMKVGNSETILWGEMKVGASFQTWRENEWNFIMKNYQHQKNGRLQRLLAKSCTQFSAMLKVWCIQNLWLEAQPLTLWSNVKHWESWKYYFKEFFATCSSLSYSMTLLDHTQVQEQMQKCNALVSPSWFTHHIVPTWHHQISFSFWNKGTFQGTVLYIGWWSQERLWKYLDFGKSM